MGPPVDRSLVEMWRDVGVTRFLVANRPPGSAPILEILSLPGNLWVIVSAVLLLTCYEVFVSANTDQQPSHVWSLVGMIVGGLALIVTLEAIFAFELPPPELRVIDARAHAFPSGHTMAATVTWIPIARYHRPHHLPVRLGSVAGIVVLVGIARMSLGVHFLPDVLAGMAFGVAYVYVSGRHAYGRPQRAFAMAIAFGSLAVLLSGMSPRGLLAFGGAVGAAAAWRVAGYVRARGHIPRQSTFDRR